ncbi:MAG: hypothetical protein A2X78_01840 [Gammaproteobacteria bacterium GWE2_37_16]|nr:MAG: hypothetical protein A2X78_01840 [Gammaproteobacteria bacterium GWE2_37_16]
MPIAIFIDGDITYNGANFNVPLNLYKLDINVHPPVPVIQGQKVPWPKIQFDRIKADYTSYLHPVLGPEAVDTQIVDLLNTVHGFYNSTLRTLSDVNYFRTIAQTNTLIDIANELLNEIDNLLSRIGRHPEVQDLQNMQGLLTRSRDRLRLDLVIGQEIDRILHPAQPRPIPPSWGTGTYVLVAVIGGMLCALTGGGLALVVAGATIKAIATGAIIGAIVGTAGSLFTVDQVWRYYQNKYQEVLNQERMAYEDSCLGLQRAGLVANFGQEDRDAALRAEQRINALALPAPQQQQRSCIIL